MGHLRFDDEEIADADPSSLVIPTLTPLHQMPPVPTSVINLPHCCNTVLAYQGRNPCYVFKTACNAPTNAIIASTSDNIIKAFSLASSELAHVCDLNGHSNTITDIQFTDPSLAHSSSTDGNVFGWDLRAHGKQAESFTSRQELHSFSVLDHLLAAGGKGEVIFWDRRSAKTPVLTLSDTHMDDVTQVKLHSSQHVISASGDGLVAVHDISKGLVDDDENFTAALNVGTSVEEVGLYGHEGERLWLRTGTETLHLWDWRLATLNDREGGNEAFAEWPEARATATQAASGGSVASLFQEVGYLVGCHYDNVSGSLMLVAGSSEGAVAFFPLQERPSRAVEAGQPGAIMLPPVMAMHGAHSEVVRSVHCFGNGTQGPLCVSGGEDGRVCLWSLDPSTARAGGGSSSSVQAAQPLGFGAQPSGAQGHPGGCKAIPAGEHGPSQRQGKQSGLGAKQFRMQPPY